MSTIPPLQTTAPTLQTTATTTVAYSTTTATTVSTSTTSTTTVPLTFVPTPTSTGYEPANNKKSGLSTGVVIAIVLAVVLVAIVIGLLWWRRSKRSRTAKENIVDKTLDKELPELPELKSHFQNQQGPQQHPKNPQDILQQQYLHQQAIEHQTQQLRALVPPGYSKGHPQWPYYEAHAPIPFQVSPTLQQGTIALSPNSVVNGPYQEQYFRRGPQLSNHPGEDVTRTVLRQPQQW